MTVSKTPKALLLLLILALAGAVVVAGCGGGGSSSSESTVTEETGPEEVEEEPAEEKEQAGGRETGGAEPSLVAEGQTVFTTNCGSCHTLKAAGTSGSVGPNLDELEPSLATVEHQVVNGGGPMPAFGNEGILNAKEIKAVATYVSAVAGNG
jgi:mono/diheme cytochrome c family protein